MYTGCLYLCYRSNCGAVNKLLCISLFMYVMSNISYSCSLMFTGHSSAWHNPSYKTQICFVALLNIIFSLAVVACMAHMICNIIILDLINPIYNLFLQLYSKKTRYTVSKRYAIYAICWVNWLSAITEFTLFGIIATQDVYAIVYVLWSCNARFISCDMIVVIYFD